MRLQGQHAGDNSAQYQVHGTLVVNQGLTAESAREIARAEAARAILEFEAEGRDTAARRISLLEDRVLELLGSRNQLTAFRDPAFQLALRKAQIGAASSERESDYDMLATLISDHAERGRERPVRAGLSKAIEVVDQLDAEALRGLTILAAISSYSPLMAECDEGLAVMNDLFADLIGDQPLPMGTDWIEHLDLLDVVRSHSITSFRKFRDFYPERMPGYVCVGLEGGTEELSAAVADLQRLGLGDPTVPHALKPGWVRVSLAKSADLERRLLQPLPADRIESIIEILRTRMKVDEVDVSLVDNFLARVDSNRYLRQIHEWWDQLTPYVTLTPVGRVLARANAQRLDARGVLPPVS